MTAERYEEMLRLRTTLEGLAAELAATRLTQEQLTELQGYVTEAKAAAEQGDMKAYLLVNRAFHFLIYGNCGSSELLKLIENLWLKCAPVFNTIFDEDYFRGHANEQHDNILEALGRRDAGAARVFMQKDIGDAATTILRVAFR